MTKLSTTFIRLQKQKDREMKRLSDQLEVLETKRHLLRRKQNAVEEKYRQKALKVRG